jgi:ATP-dependent DNA ligase
VPKTSHFTGTICAPAALRKKRRLQDDGPIVVLDSNGKSLFYELMHSKPIPIFAAFDLLRLDGADVRD